MVAAREVRRLALRLPGAEEHRHREQRDYRVRGRVFATLHAARRRLVVTLSRADQRILARAQPLVFRVADWERQGRTSIDLRRVDPWILEELLVGAWRRHASRSALADWRAQRRVALTGPEAPGPGGRRR